MTVRKNKVNNLVQTQLTLEQILAWLQPYRQEIIGAALMLLSAITVLSLLSLTGGALSAWWAGVFSQLFGWGAAPAAILVGILGGLFTFSRLRDESRPWPLDIIIGVEILLAVGLAVTHLVVAADSDQALRLARA